MEQGIIEIRIDNVSKEETLRLQDIIHTLIYNGSLHLRAGRAILHYDHEGTLQKIEHEFIKYLKAKPNTKAAPR